MVDFQLTGPSYVDDYINSHRRDHRTILLEAHFSSCDHPDSCRRSIHIPGALQVHPSYLEAGPNREKYYPFYDHPSDGNLLPRKLLIKAIEWLGITSDTEVIVYGSDPDGPMSAARLIWGLMYAGVKKIRMLDGGLNAWISFGGKTTSRIRKVEELVEQPSNTYRSWEIRSEFLASTGDVRKVVKANSNSSTRLVDVRRTGEYTGDIDRNYTFFATAGHIPTAVSHGNWDSLIEKNSQLIGSNLENVKAHWHDLGIINANLASDPTDLIFYCGTGWRSSVSFLIATLLGISARNYDDGFYGWSWDKENAISTGR